MWAAGIMLYNMIMGQLPFDGETDEDLIYFVKKFKHKYPENLFTSSIKELCVNLLNKDPVQRWSAAEAKNSNWIQNYLNLESTKC